MYFISELQAFLTRLSLSKSMMPTSPKLAAAANGDFDSDSDIESNLESESAPMFCPLGMFSQGTASCGRSARQEEKWQQREARLLDLTQSLIEESGFAHFNIDRLVRVSDVSKGTIYNHFSSKEDCLAAFCIRGMSELRGLFERALMFDGNPREVALAIHFAYRLHLKLNPTACMALVNARTPSFAEKTSPERSKKLKKVDGELFAMAFKVIDDAIKAGELQQSEDLPEVVITFLNWSMSYGINMLASTGFDPSVSKFLEERNIALIGANVLMDGLGMTPLSKDWDYKNTWQRIADEIFAEEITMINKGDPLNTRGN